MTNTAWVVTNTDLGWDCIVGLFDPKVFTREDLEERFPRRLSYVVHYSKHTIHTDLEDFD